MAFPCSTTCDQSNYEEKSSQEMRIILLGKTGQGKSSLGNSICGSKEKNKPFQAKPSSSSVTMVSEYAYRIYNNRKLCVIDTPGLCDTEQLNQVVIEELKRAFHYACPGPRAFLIVVNGRCTEEQIGVLLLLQRLFGNYIIKYCIIVITRENDLRDGDDNNQLSDAQLIKQYFSGAPEALLTLMNDIGNRCILIENRAAFEIREQKIALLIQMIEAIEKENGYYTNDMLIEAEQQYQQSEKEEIERQRLDREKRREKLRKQIREENLSREETLRREEQLNEELRREEEHYDEEMREIRRRKIRRGRLCGKIVRMLNTLSGLIPDPYISYNASDGWNFRS